MTPTRLVALRARSTSRGLAAAWQQSPTGSAMGGSGSYLCRVAQMRACSPPRLREAGCSLDGTAGVLVYCDRNVASTDLGCVSLRRVTPGWPVRKVYDWRGASHGCGWRPRSAAAPSLSESNVN